jgi:uncharacterized protein YgbK (DUF1537 family)
VSQVVLIADDLTGAADSGVAFAVHGLRSAIVLGSAPALDVDVLILSTGSRDGDVDAAVLAHRLAVDGLVGEHGASIPRWVYKKVDSALRGHPGTELRAVMDALGETTALVAPALPSEGRTTLGARQHIGDARLEQDSAGGQGIGIDLIERFGGQSGQPVHHLEIDTVRAGVDAVSQFLETAGAGIVVADAETDADLFTIASAAAESPIRLLCGAAGFARQCARALPLDRSSHPDLRQQVGDGPVLVIAGSTHPATVAQVDHLHRAGYTMVRPSQAWLNGDTSAGDTTARSLAEHLAEGRPVVLTTAGMGESPRGTSFVSSHLADIVAEAVACTRIAGVVISGGDVAASVLAGLGANVMHLHGEVRPAMPWGLVEPAALPPLLAVTKAGSFGTPEALEAAADFLTSQFAAN